MDSYKMNRLANVHNKFQGKFKKVLCVCSAGLLRSPSTAVVLSQEPYNYNTRSAGLVPQFALIPVDEVLLEWADEIVCMEKDQADKLSLLTSKPIICLDISDDFWYREPDLMNLIKTQYDKKTANKITEEEDDNN
jgi:predicted protein tyrosine phosphatase